MHPPSKMERDSLEHRREEGANLEEMTSEEVGMLHDALSNVPQSSKHLISTGSSSTANISNHIVILQCTARVSLQGAHEDLGKYCKFQIYEVRVATLCCVMVMDQRTIRCQQNCTREWRKITHTRKKGWYNDSGRGKSEYLPLSSQTETWLKSMKECDETACEARKRLKFLRHRQISRERKCQQT